MDVSYSLDELDGSDFQAVREHAGHHSLALKAAIKAHEAFRQEVSDALLEYYGGYHNASGETLERFIITKPDPLVNVLDDLGWFSGEEEVGNLRAALEARGLEIREKGA